MIGGPPIAQPYPQYQYLPPAYAQQVPTARPVPRPQQAVVRPVASVARGQSPDEAPARPAVRRPLEMPPPEALGVPMPATDLDWTDLRVRLDRLGATGFALEKLPAGGYRFGCQVPAAGGQSRTVEGRAATEAEAVRRALEQAAGR
jgi:hypothetical protein